VTEEEKIQERERILQSRSARLAGTIIVLLVAVGMLLSFNIWYTKNAIHKSNQLWCSLIVGLDDNYRAAPPDTLPERTRVFAAQIHDIREGLDCRHTTLPQPPSPKASGND
jgi:hypothetical protein